MFHLPYVRNVTAKLTKSVIRLKQGIFKAERKYKAIKYLVVTNRFVRRCSIVTCPVSSTQRTSQSYPVKSSQHKVTISPFAILFYLILKSYIPLIYPQINLYPVKFFYISETFSVSDSFLVVYSFEVVSSSDIRNNEE